MRVGTKGLVEHSVYLLFTTYSLLFSTRLQVPYKIAAKPCFASELIR